LILLVNLCKDSLVLIKGSLGSFTVLIGTHAMISVKIYHEVELQH